MARKNARGLELSFHKATKRWCKHIAGKDRYYGKGSGVSDRESYRLAVARYRAEQDEAARRGLVPQRSDFATEKEWRRAFEEIQLKALKEQYDQREAGIATHNELAADFYGNENIETISQRSALSRAMTDPQIEELIRQQVNNREGPKRQRRRIADLIADYMKAVEQRYKSKQGISKKHLSRLRRKTHLFTSFK